MAKRSRPTVTSLTSFMTFARHFVHYCFVLRGILGAQFALVLLTGAVFSQVENVPIADACYFALITASTVGYGDITPHTGVGKGISVFLAFQGTIFFGLVVAVATQAFTVTIKEYLLAHGKSADHP